MAAKKGDDDRALFRRHLGNVRPVKQDKIAPSPRRRKPVPLQRRKDERAVMASLLSDDYELAEVETGEELLFARPGLQHRVMRKLRRGEYAIQAELDLHGRKVPEARELVADFLRRSQNQGLRCVRIIHGKGLSSEGKLPVIKGKVNSWLRQKEEVLAFCSATRRDGGTGAVYVLVKRK